jgi:hypothetical protein
MQIAIKPTGHAAIFCGLALSAAVASTAPDAPTAISAIGGNAQARVSFTAPANNGGAAITGYTATASPGGLTATGASSPLTITGLTNGTSYTFTVTATNSAGTGAASSASSAVVGDWAVNYGLSDSRGLVQATATDAAGNVYIAGNFDGETLPLGGVTLTRLGIRDAFVAKINAAGTVVWAKNFGGSGATVYGRTIAVDSAGSVYLSGYFVNASLTGAGAHEDRQHRRRADQAVQRPGPVPARGWTRFIDRQDFSS